MEPRKDQPQGASETGGDASLNRMKNDPTAQRPESFGSSMEPDSGPREGSEWSSVGENDSVAHYPPTNSEDVPSQRVTSAHGGAVRDGFFKKRDYE